MLDIPDLSWGSFFAFLIYIQVPLIVRTVTRRSTIGMPLKSICVAGITVILNYLWMYLSGLTEQRSHVEILGYLAVTALLGVIFFWIISFSPRNKSSS